MCYLHTPNWCDHALGLQYKAVEAYQRAITINKRHFTAMRNLAGIYRSLGNDGDAEEMYKL